MKNRKTLRILGIAVILSLLMALIPAAAVFAVTPTTNTFTLSPTSARVGETVTVNGAFIPSASEYWINVYLSPNNINLVGTVLITTATTYHLVGGATLQMTGDNPDGTFTGSFAVPANLTTGTVDLPVASGTYYVYLTKVATNGAETGIYAKQTLTITAPALDPLSPATGVAGTAVTVTGSNFPASTALVFKVDTTTITPTSGDTSTRTSGLFITTITIPVGTAAGAHVITVTAGASTAAATFTVTASASLSPLVPLTGAPSSTVVITGAAFPVSTVLTFLWDTTTISPTGGNTATNTAGTFSTTLTVPATAANGAHVITVTAGTTTLTATFTVAGAVEPTTTTTTPPPTTTTPPPTTTTTPPPTTTTAPPPGTTTLPLIHTGNPDTAIDLLAPVTSPGASATIIGVNFTPSAAVIIKFENTQVGTATATAKGVVSTAFTVPSSAPGNRLVTITDGINTDSLYITIESTAPAVPQPTAPGMGAKVKSPVKFDWGDVTDPSLPVTYNLQIATDSNFPAASILIDKTKLATSEYTLTDLELAKLSDSKVNYYWREKSVDGALNESAWTGAGAFTVTQPFKFAGPILYGAIAVGAIIVFLLGILVGRRTAFYY